jgi:tRNA (adenine22-N1)-methyltransferase
MISLRLQAIASFLPPAKTIADVGCDHGFLIIEGFLKHHLEKAVAIDNKPLPLAKAKNNLLGYDFFDRVDFILSNGLENLASEVDAIILAGMGGMTVIGILSDHFSKIGKSRLIIQANRDVMEVRKFLAERGYAIADEKVIFEDRKFYEICVFEKSLQPVVYSENELQFGPVLLQKRDDAFLSKLRNDLRILTAIQFQTEENQKRIKDIKEILC